MTIEVADLNDVSFSPRSRSSKYDQYLEPVAELEEGKALILTPPEGVKMTSFAQSIRAAVKDGIDSRDGYKFRTRNTEDGKLAVWWSEQGEDDSDD